MRVGPAEGEPKRLVELLERLVVADRNRAHGGGVRSAGKG